MAFEYRGRTGIVAIALLAALILLLPADVEASQCSRENRVNVRDAECLSASWKNPGPFRKSTYRVRNTCPLYGQVDAKVDLVGARDRTVNLDNGRARRGWAWRHIRSVSCCSDTGICNRSDAVTDEGCVARFKQVSSAHLSCWDITASAATSGENYRCTLTARCYLNTFPRPFTNVSTITVPFFALANVHNCNGTLNAGPCNDDPPDTARVSVRDATAVELFLPSLDFRVFLSRMLWETVRIDYATLDGTATAGSPRGRRGRIGGAAYVPPPPWGRGTGGGGQARQGTFAVVLAVVVRGRWTGDVRRPGAIGRPVLRGAANDGLGTARGNARAGGDAVDRVAAAGQEARRVGDGETAGVREGVDEGNEQLVTVHHKTYMHDHT